MGEHDKFSDLSDDDLQCLIEQFITSRKEKVTSEEVHLLFSVIKSCNIINNYVKACLVGNYHITDINQIGVPIFEEFKFNCPLMDEVAAIVESRIKLDST